MSVAWRNSSDTISTFISAGGENNLTYFETEYFHKVYNIHFLFCVIFKKTKETKTIQRLQNTK